MLPRKHRINSELFQEIMKKGHRRPFSFGLIYTYPGPNPLFAVAVPKKVEKTSVGRHRLKRRILGCILKLSLPKQAIILVPNNKLDSLSHTEMFEVLKTLLDSLSKN
jgi:ribonuclease P protein component